MTPRPSRRRRVGELLAPVLNAMCSTTTQAIVALFGTAMSASMDT